MLSTPQTFLPKNHNALPTQILQCAGSPRVLPQDVREKANERRGGRNEDRPATRPPRGLPHTHAALGSAPTADLTAERREHRTVPSSLRGSSTFICMETTSTHSKERRSLKLPHMRVVTSHFQAFRKPSSDSPANHTSSVPTIIP